MPFGPGSRLGPYQIVAPVGAGGMGEVYRALDTRLDRTVAVKVLSVAFSSDVRLRIRFEQEAKAISALTHPNICTLYDVGRDDGTDYLVMEFCEGESLADRLARGAMPLSDAAGIGAEIASALDRAHEHGVIHRDVKPGNVMVTPSGARLLDFGLAGNDPESAPSETISESAGDDGMVGTLAYMAPEQFEGKPPDARSDIWSLGAVVYEMTTGTPAFRGDSRAELIVSVLTRDPDFDAVSDPSLRHVIRKCLRKNADQRWQSARDVADEMRWIAEHVSGSRRRRTAAIAIGAAAIAAVGLAAMAGWTAWRTRTDPVPLRLSVSLPAESRLVFDVPGFSLSPDGSHVVFSVFRPDGNWEIYSRRLDHFEPTLVAHGINPAVSPDGEWIAFVRGRTLFKAPIEGGREDPLADLRGNPRGISWAPDGTIYFAIGFDGGLAKVAADGSGFAMVTVPDESRDENSHRWPHVLPDGKHLLFTIRTGRISSFSDARIAVLSLQTGRWRTVFEGGSCPSYLPTGHLVFVRDSALMVAPFDLETLNVQGSPVPLVHDIFHFPASGVGQYAVSAGTGILAYVSGGVVGDRGSRFAIVDRRGAVEEVFTVPKSVDSFRVSPDSSRVAIQASAANDDIWTWDVHRKALTRVSVESGDEILPFWAPDGMSILFSGRKGLHRQAADGSAAAELLVERRTGSASCSPGCDTVAFTAHGRSRDVWISRPGRAETPSLFVGTPFQETAPEFSPDGRSIAYASDESGTREVYVRPLDGGGRAQVSAGGGTDHRWLRDGRELYYRWRDQFFAVRIDSESLLAVGPPQLLFRSPKIRNWDVFGDGFILLEQWMPPFLGGGINVIPAWLEEVEARVPSE